MATQMRGPYQDPEFNVHANVAGFSIGPTYVSKAQKKGGLGGRKPLGEISNSIKQPSQNQVPKKLNSVDTSITQVKEKVKTGGRKPLGDISNLGKPSNRAASNKNLSNSVDIGDEGFLHNHKNCMKAQGHMESVNMDYFVETIGLGKASSFGLAIPSVLPSSSKVETGGQLMRSDWEIDNEIVELLPEDSSPRHKKVWLEMESSTPLCKSPRSPNFSHSNYWMDHHDCPEFMLKESPVQPER